MIEPDHAAFAAVKSFVALALSVAGPRPPPHLE
jgi:hypothetical protein